MPRWNGPPPRGRPRQPAFAAPPLRRGKEGVMTIEADRLELFAPPRYRFDLARRDFFRVVGTGLVVACAVGEADAQESGRARREELPADIGAWLHIADDGTVTVYTGKTEVGQNIRTSLTQAVCEELRVAPASVRLVMA